MVELNSGVVEGYITVPGGQVWYRIVGSGDSIPILTLHGGPGAGHDYLESLEVLASNSRSVVFYDQLGCGNSDQPIDRSLWQIERFLAEISAVRQALGLERIHLFGQSWGGWLAIEYMLTKPPGVVSLILANTSASVSEYIHEVERLKSELPSEIFVAMQRYEAENDFHNPQYEAAVIEFYKQHLCRLDPWPDSLMRTLKIVEGNPVYETMWGPNELMVTGNLKDWDRTDSLSEIKVPTLITVGRHDATTPNCAETIHQGIIGSEVHVFEKSGHTAHLEEPDVYMRVISAFVERVEQDLSR